MTFSITALPTNHPRGNIARGSISFTCCAISIIHAAA